MSFIMLFTVHNEQIVALSRLAELRSKFLDAILLLLRNDLWDEAFALLSRASKATTETVNAQLFESFLHEALRKKQSVVFDKLWSFLPKSMKPLDLAHIISSYISSDKTSLPLDQSAAYTVGMFRGAFIKLLENQSSS